VGRGGRHGARARADGRDPDFNKPDPVFPSYVAAGHAVVEAAVGRWFAEARL